MGRTSILLVLPAHCTGRDILRTMVALEWVSPSLSQTIKSLTLSPAPFPMSVCVCRFPVPAGADPAPFPLCISGNFCETHLYPEQWFQSW